MIEQLTNRYRVVSLLGQGGMGSVFLAEDATTGERVALKTLALRSAGDPAEALLRFRQEFRTMARMRHPHLVEVHDFGQLEDGTPFFTMEVVPGKGLDEALPMSPEEAKGILIQLCQALAYIHQQGLVHCDIKPENIRITPEGCLKLMDFGLMSPSGQTGGSIKGTLLYLAPEVARRAKVDARSDLYSVGALAYHLLAGRPPFEGDDPVVLLRAHMEQEPEPLRSLCPALTPELEQAIDRLLAKDPMARYPSTYDLLADLGVVSDEEDKGSLFSAPFIGRESELATFDARLTDLTAALPMHLAGPAGAGKSRLLEEFRFRAQLAGPMVLVGHCQEDAIPYGPFREVLRAAIASLDGQEIAPLRGALAGLLPELAAAGFEENLDPQQVKLKLQNGIGDLLALAARAQGLVLMLDDWHWADPSSVELWDVLARRLEGQPVLLVTAGRDEAADALLLASFQPAEVREMAQAMLGTEELDEGFLTQLTELTGGNPFFIEGALRHLWQEDLLKRVRGRWQTAGLVLDASDLPADVHALLLKRLAQFSKGALSVAEYAAALGQPLPIGRLARLAGGEDSLFEALGELGREGVLRTEDGLVRFLGGQYAEAIYGRLDAEARLELHTRVATLLSEELAGDERLEALFELARHHLASRTPGRGVSHALAAARKSFALYGLQQAKELLEAGEPHATEGQDRLGFAHLLGDIYRFMAQLDVAEGHYERALALARQLCERSQEATLLTSMGLIFQIRSQYPLAMEKVEAALAVLAEFPQPRERLRALTMQGRLHNFMGHGAQAIATSEEALALAREEGDMPVVSRSLGFLGLLYVQGSPDRIETGLQYLEESRAIKEQLGDKVGLNDTLNLLGNAQVAIGRYAEALASFEQSMQLCREIGIRDDEICALINLGMVAYELGRFAKAAEHARAAHEGAANTGNRLYEGIALAMWAVAEAEKGELSLARALLARVDALALEAKNSYLDVTVMTYGVEVELLLGRLHAALARSERVAELVKESGIDEYEARHGVLRAELLMRLGEGDEAAKLLEIVLERAAKNQALGVQARALAMRATMELRNWDERCAATCRAAREAAQAGGMAFVEAQVRWVEGQDALRRGAAGEAREAFEAARELAVDLPCLRQQALGIFGLACSEGRSAKAYQLLPQARELLKAMLGSLEGEDRDQVLALDELWRLERGDLDPEARPGEGGGGVSDSRYLVAVQETQRLQGRIEELDSTSTSLQHLIRFTSESHEASELLPLLDATVSFVVKLVETDRVFLLLEEDGKLRIKASTLDFRDRNPRNWQYSESIVDAVFREGISRYAPDTFGEVDISRSVADLQIRSVLCVPLLYHGKPLGVIYADRKTARKPFSEPEKILVETLAGQAAHAVMSVQLRSESLEHSRQLEMLNNLARTVSTTLVLSEVLDLVVDFTLKLTSSDRAFILLTDDGEVLHCKLARDRRGIELTESGAQISGSITQRVLNTLEAECVLDTHNHEQLQTQQSILDLNLRTVMCVPLMVKQEPLGVLYVDSQAVVNAFTSRDLDLLKAIASQASVAIQNARLYERATVDGLTRLYVRSYFEQRLSSELRRTLRYGGDVSVMMMDIDHFKKFNDSYGHSTGDEVLKLVARVIMDGIREELDIPGRFGGEEMLVLMPETGTQGAMVLAERLRHAIASTELPGPNGEILHVQVSIGVASAPGHAKTAIELVEFADQALYRSKRGGRNQVTLYDPDFKA